MLSTVLKYNFLKILFFFIFFTSSLSILYSKIYILENNDQKITFEYYPEFLGLDTILTTNNIIAYYPKIKETFLYGTTFGAPAHLLYREIITVPSPDKFQLESFQAINIKEHPGFIVPKPYPKSISDFISEEFILNYNEYSNYKAPEWVSVEYAGIARNRHIANINIIASRYNPLKNTIEIPEKIIISIKFNSKQYINSEAIEDFTTPTTLNHYQTYNWLIKTSSKIINTQKNETILNNTNSTAVKIAIEHEGLYRIDNSMLSNLGININKEDIPTIKIYCKDGFELSRKVSDAVNNQLDELPIIVNTKSDGSLNYILFYAVPSNGFYYDKNRFRHKINRFSNKNYYILTWGNAPGKRIEIQTTPTEIAVNKPNTYTEMIFFEEELNNAFSNGSGMEWFGRTVFPTIFTNTLHNLDRSTNITYRFSVAHRANAVGTFSIYEGNNLLSEITLNELGYYQQAHRKEGEASLSASYLPLDNKSTLRFTYSNSLTNAIPFFDWYEIFYRRSFIPINNEIAFFSDTDISGITEYRIDGFNNYIYGFDVTDRKNPKLLENNSNSPGTFIFKTQIELNNPKRFFITSNIKSPSSLTKTVIANYRNYTEGADLILITPPEFLQSATKYKEYRESKNNIKVFIAVTDLIYNEFSAGLPDYTAIRDFIAFAYYNWQTKPKYVLLWGDGHYDYRNITTNKPNYVPVFESDDNYNVFDATDSYCSDDYFVKVVGDDDLIDLAIGRITIDSPEIGEWMLDKIKIYENTSSPDIWRSTITLLADDSWKNSPYGDGNKHTSQTEELSRIIPQSFQQKKIYLVEYPQVIMSGGIKKPSATEELLSTINTTSSLLLNWIGHGNPRVWAHEELLDRDITIQQFNNLDKLFFAVAATCDFGRYDMTETRSGAEELLLSKYGGSIGVFSATRLVFADQNALINYAFYNELFNRNPITKEFPTLGEALFTLKQRFNKPNDIKYNILGDPFLKLNIPFYLIRLDSFNETEIKSDSTEFKDTIRLKALSQVTLKGSIIDPKTNTIDYNFNGNVIVTMLDSDEKISATDYDGSIHNINKFGPALNKSSYPVQNGKFTANFILPKDINHTTELGRLFFFSSSNDDKYAMGSFRNFTIKGIDTTTIVDTTGPEIKIFIDSRYFKKGDIVSKTPLLIIDLYDESGINTTGRGIGHLIEVWIDDNINSINLTPKFINSKFDSRAGTVEEYLYGLSPGYHKIKVRAWDVFNNFSINYTDFIIVSDNDEIVISEFYCLPNPFEQDAIFFFKHNITPPYSAELYIYDLEGKIVDKISKDLSTLQVGEIPYNSKSSNDYLISQGSFLAQILLKSKSGKMGKKSILINHIR